MTYSFRDETSSVDLELFSKAAELFKRGLNSDAETVYTALLTEEAPDDNSARKVILLSQADYVRALCNRSACYTNLGRYEDALKDGREALSFSEEISDTHHNSISPGKPHVRIAYALEGLLRLEEALEHMKLAVKCDGTLATSQAPIIKRLETLIASGRGIASDTTKKTYYYDKSLREGKECIEKAPLEAARHFSRALELCTEQDLPVLLSNRSAAYFRAAKFDCSLEDAQLSVKKKPDYVRAHVRVALALKALGRRVEAVDAAEVLLKLDPLNETGKQIIVDLKDTVTATLPSDDVTTAEIGTSGASHVPSTKSQDDDGTPTTNILRPLHNRTCFTRGYSSSTILCSLCNMYGHRKQECPSRKRPRD
eukprot:Tbor_TRINITY_DN5939_c0_g4::TRINITY_DN5939_c0_g4_i1::g.18739::m.18739